MKSASQAFMQKLAAGWGVGSSPLPAMDAGLAKATSQGMQGSTPVGAVPGRAHAAAVKMDKTPKVPKPQPTNLNKLSADLTIRADGKDYTIADVIEGMKVETEHAATVDNDPRKMMGIALDHLDEDKDYYTKLKKMEAKEASMKDIEIKGFIDKCAELGVDPTVAIKYAATTNAPPVASKAPGLMNKIDRAWNKARWYIPGFVNERGNKSSLMGPVPTAKPTPKPTPIVPAPEPAGDFDGAVGRSMSQKSRVLK